MRTQDEIVERARSRKPMDMTLTMKAGEAQLMNLNSRAEGSKEDPIPACDLKFECTTDGAVLKPILGADDVPDFWKDNGEPRYYGIDSMKSRGEMDSANVTFGSIALKDVEVNKITFKPAAGRQVGLTLTVQLRPSDDEYLALIHAQYAWAELSIEPCQGDLYDNE